MKIALDYDDTYTRDKILWNAFIRACQFQGYSVYIVTARNERNFNDLQEDGLFEMVNAVYFTNGKAKKAFMYQQMIDISIWIDDNPNNIINDLEGTWNGYENDPEELY